MLTIENLIKAYVAPDGSRVPTIDIPAFSQGAGEQLALIGTSGSGKTTLLHMIAGILVPDSGKIEYDLHNPNAGAATPAVAAGGPIAYRSARGDMVELTQLSEAARDGFRARHIGYIFQTHHLLPGFTAMENVLLGMSFSGRKIDRAWASHVLDRLGLTDRLGYKPAKLSLGQQQRVAVARALVNRPALVLADEPTGSLDPKTAAAVLELIRTLCRETSAALLMVTHDHGLAASFPRVVELSAINRALSVGGAA